MPKATQVIAALVVALALQQGRSNAQEREPAFQTPTLGVKPLTPVIDMGNSIRKMKVKITYLLINRRTGQINQDSPTEWAFYDCKNHRIAFGFRSDGADTEWVDAWNRETNEIGNWNAERNPAYWQRVMCK